MKRILLLFLLPTLLVQAKSSSTLLQNMELNGYVKYMNTAMFSHPDSMWMVDNLIHNRLNYTWYINDKLNVVAGMRNRFIYGDFVKFMPNYAQGLEQDDGVLHFLTNNISDGQSYVLTSTFDRAYFEYNSDKWTWTLGRQRINWGQSLAWNPNDIFNTYSFFDFDYEERPGSDALRAQYFPNYTSVVEGAVKVDRNNQVTAAALYRFNKWGYDLQLLGGVLDTTDYMIGAGWSGSVKDFGFTGEVSYFHPQEKSTDSIGVAIVTAGLSYMFSNSLSLTFEANYNAFYEHLNIANFNSQFSMPLSVKTSSFSRFSYFAQLAYPIHPLLSASLATMYFPSLENGYFVMPSLSFSLSDNVECALYGQYFEGQFSAQKETITMAFLRFRYSF